jgi:hypothetical protein
MSGLPVTGKTVLLSVGEQFHLKSGKDRIVYAGMLSESVYSIIQKKATGYQGYSWNLYYPKNKRDITIDGVRVYIEKVTPDEIEIRVQR